MRSWRLKLRRRWLLLLLLIVARWWQSRLNSPFPLVSPLRFMSGLVVALRQSLVLVSRLVMAVLTLLPPDTLAKLLEIPARTKLGRWGRGAPFKRRSGRRFSTEGGRTS